MVKYPLHFKVESRSLPGINTDWQSWTHSHSEVNGQISGRPIECSVPKEFSGPGDAIAPESLFAMALSNCYVATFKILAERENLSFEEIKVSTDLVVDRGPGGRPFMKFATLHVDVRNPSEWGRCEKLLRSTVQSCLAINSVKTEIQFDFQMHADEFGTGPSHAA